MKHEYHDENRNYVRQWPLEMHRKALSDGKYSSLIVEDEQMHPVGYALIV
jgi:hypothetical protein